MKRVKNIIECLIIICTVLAGGLYLGKMLNPAFTDGSMEQVKAFRLLPEDSVEVIAFGSSHTWRGLRPMTMYDNYGIGCYNYGGNWQTLNTSLMYLEDSIQTQSPKAVLMETYQVNAILQDVNMDGQIYYSKAVPMFEGKWNYLKQCFGKDLGRWISYYYPLVMFHSSWNGVNAENFRDEVTAESRLKEMGFSYSTTVVPVEVPDYEDLQQEQLSEASVETLDKIVSVCDENNIQLVLYTAPSGTEYNYHDAVDEYAKAHDIPYIDFYVLFDEAGFDGATDFSDIDHLNASGSEKVADYLGKYLTENYELTDMRLIENNLWEQMKEE